MKQCTSCNQLKPYSDFYTSKAYLDGYKTQCKECSRRKAAQWREKNRERAKATQARWRKQNPTYHKDYYWNHKKETKKTPRSYKAPNKQQYPNVQGQFTLEEWNSILAAFGFVCAYCGNNWGKPLTLDHMTPLSRGGEHTMFNIVPACLGCNASKGKRTAEEYETVCPGCVEHIQKCQDKLR